MHRHFPAKRAKYWNIRIIKNTASIVTKFCRPIETHKYSLRGVQVCPNKSKLADGRHLEKSKDLNSKNRNIFTTEWLILKKFDSDTSGPCRHRQPIKFCKMKVDAILKNLKILISLQPMDWFWQNLVRWCVSTLCTPIANKISRFQKSKMAAAVVRKIENLQYLGYGGPVSRKSGMVLCLDPPDLVSI